MTRNNDITRAAVAALKAFEAGLADGSIKWAKPRQSDSDPYHPANTLMCAALALVDEQKPAPFTFILPVNVVVTYQQVADALCCAFEGGSFWPTVINKTAPPALAFRSEPGDRVYPLYDFPLNEGGSLTIIAEFDGERDEVDGKTEWELNLQTIAAGLLIVQSNFPEIFRQLLTENECDANTGDMLLQVCCFGTEVYS